MKGAARVSSFFSKGPNLKITSFFFFCGGGGGGGGGGAGGSVFFFLQRIQI